MFGRGKRSIAARNGAKIVSINPLLETGMIRFKHPQHPADMLGKATPIACLHLPVKINGDVAVLKGIMKEMLEMDRKRARCQHEVVREVRLAQLGREARRLGKQAGRDSRRRDQPVLTSAVCGRDRDDRSPELIEQPGDVSGVRCGRQDGRRDREAP